MEDDAVINSYTTLTDVTKRRFEDTYQIGGQWTDLVRGPPTDASSGPHRGGLGGSINEEGGR
jgi:hypothetical protein